MGMARAIRVMAFLAVITVMTVAQVKNVAVVETDVDAASGASAEITSADVRQVTAELRREAVKNLPSDKYNIMTSETVQAQGSAVLEECAEENCVIALGSRIGADYIVRGTISKLRTRFTLTVEVYETENGNLVASSTPVRSESIEDLVEKAEAACVEMFGKFVSTQGSKQKPRTRYTLDVSADPAVGGTVLRSPKKDEYTSGEVVNVVAVPANGYVFTGWLGASTDTANTLTVTMNANKVLMAKFASQSGVRVTETAEAAQPVKKAAPANAATVKKGKDLENKSYGFGGFYTSKSGSGFSWDESEEAIAMPYSGGGAYFYQDVSKYIGVSAGIIYASGRWESVAASNPNELPDMDRMGADLSIAFKYPVEEELPLNIGSVAFYPFLGVDLGMTYNSVRKHGSASEKYKDLSVFSQEAGYILGGGIDYRFGKKMHVRFEAAYNGWIDLYYIYMLLNTVTQSPDKTAMYGSNPINPVPRAGEGVILKFGVGFGY